MKHRRLFTGFAGLVLILSGCGGDAPKPAESPRPTASLRGGVRGELGEAQEAESRRREQENRLLDDPTGAATP